MAEFKTLPLDKVLVPERLREVEEDHAFMISQSIGRIGLLNPITVRATPRGERPYTLVAGAHRLRGCELAGRTEIDTIVVKADKTDGQMVEIEENIFRNELSALDRAIFVRRYRELWEEKHGWDKGGRPSAETSAKFAEVSEDSAQGNFFRHVSERLGLSRRGVEYAQFIGKALTPELRQKLRGTPDADNQGLLLRLARLETKRQGQIATAIALVPDVKRAIGLTDPHAKAKAVKTVQTELLDRLISTWKRTDDKTKSEFLAYVQRDEIERRKQSDVTDPDPRQVTIFDLIKASAEGAVQ